MRIMRRRELLGIAAGAALANGQTAAPAAAKITSSVMLWTLPGSFEEKLAAAAQAGLQSVELVREHDQWSAAQAEQARKRLRSFGLTVDAVSSNPNFGSTAAASPLNPAERPALLAEVGRHLLMAQRLEAPMALFMAGNRIAGKPDDEQWASLVESCKRAGDRAAKAGITLIVEPLNTKVNHKGYFLENCTDGVRLMREVDHPHVRLLYDLYHEQVQTGDASKMLEAALPFVKVFHVADNPGRHDPGTGTMKFAEIYRAIRKLNFQGHIAMEYLPVGLAAHSLIKAVDAMRSALAA